MSQLFTDLPTFRKRYPIRPLDPAMLLGSGSYGRVVKVEDQIDTEWVAIKISEVKGEDSKSLLEEVKLAQGIPRHANIARYDACYRLETDTNLCDFAVMKYYPDGNLAALLHRQPPTPAQLYDLTKGILLGLQHLHGHRVVHRDFKPANILISRDNQQKLIPKIADFGLSKLVGSIEIDNSDFDLSDGRGTPSYKAPEQIEGSRISFNLDLWAFGVILYEMMLGEKPFAAGVHSSDGSARMAIERTIMAARLPARTGEIAQPYQAIIRRCLVRDIHQRARKADELLDLLDNIPPLLTQAQTLYEQRQYDQARTVYEQILHLSPNHAAAIRGLGLCIENSRPAPPANTPPRDEPTDTYVPIPAPADVPPTDVFTPALASKTSPAKRRVSAPRPVRETKAATEPPRPAPTARPAPVSAPDAAPVTTAPASNNVPATNTPSQSTAFPWRYALPVAVAVVGFGLYAALLGKSKTIIETSKKSTDSTVIGTNVPDPKFFATPATVAASGKLPVAAKTLPINPPGLLRVMALMEKKGDAAEARRLKAYYNRAATGTPQKQQEAQTYLWQMAVKYGAGTAVTPPPVGPALATNPVTTSVAANLVAANVPPTEPKPAEPDAAGVKRAAQQQYEQLIDQGAAAISKGNNKPAAMGFFAEARQLADKHDLTTDKGRVRYDAYMRIASQIMSSDDYESAKKWFLVAQSVSNTGDVRTKLKQCDNQLSAN